MSNQQPIICDPQKLQDTIHNTVEEVFNERFEHKFEESVAAITSRVIWNWKSLSIIVSIVLSLGGLYWQQDINTKELASNQVIISNADVVENRLESNTKILENTATKEDVARIEKALHALTAQVINSRF